MTIIVGLCRTHNVRKDVLHVVTSFQRKNDVTPSDAMTNAILL